MAWNFSNSPTNRYVQEFFDDGTNFYVLQHTRPKTAPYTAWDRSAVVSRSTSGQLYRSGYPAYVVGEPAMQILFYLYASSSYFNALKSNRVDEILLGAPIFGGNRKVKAFVTRRQDALGLPEHIVFHDFEGKGITNAILHVSAFTNIGKFHIPLSAKLSRRKQRDGSEQESYEFSVNRVALRSSVTNFTPPLVVPTTLNDFRFSHGQAIVPSISLGSRTNWPSEEFARQQPGYGMTQRDWERKEW